MKQKAQAALLTWYEQNGRHDLPWRNTDDVYHVYISEIMLQQTQVKRVKQEYYPRFLQAFPTLKHLANAKEEDVLATWSGLGYYSRARNLHKTAKLCSETVPTAQEELLKLPGIGRYTASAVCSFAYNQAVPVVDTNIARVIRRLFALKEASDEDVWKYAESFLHIKEPRAHNLALMDLGSLICLPTSPKCNECPLNLTCKGKDSVELYTKKKKTEYEAMELFYGVAIKENKIALKLSKGPMYKGMLELPSIDPIEEDFLADFKHSYTKYRLTVKLYKSEVDSAEVEWLALDDVENAHISSLTRKALKALA